MACNILPSAYRKTQQESTLWPLRRGNFAARFRLVVVSALDIRRAHDIHTAGRRRSDTYSSNSSIMAFKSSAVHACCARSHAV